MVNRDNNADDTRKDLRNEDPITGAPGSHPIGTGVGAALGGAAAGAAAGAFGGPVGAIVGAAAGAVAGGYGGKAVAEAIDPTVESAYWRENYKTRDYYDPKLEYEVYEPAYRTGWETYEPAVTFEEREADLRRRWEADNQNSNLSWNQAREAMRDSWTRLSDRHSVNVDETPRNIDPADRARNRPK
jgi:hypothetical protein